MLKYPIPITLIYNNNLSTLSETYGIEKQHCRSQRQPVPCNIGAFSFQRQKKKNNKKKKTREISNDQRENA